MRTIAKNLLLLAAGAAACVVPVRLGAQFAPVTAETPRFSLIEPA